MIVKFKEVCHIQKLVPKVNAYASFHKIQSKPTVPLQALIIHQPLLECLKLFLFALLFFSFFRQIIQRRIDQFVLLSHQNTVNISTDGKEL
jgi:hypothetical protein